MKMKKAEFEQCCDQLFEIEIKSVEDVLKDAAKDVKARKISEDSLQNHSLMAHAYLKGLRRAKEILTIVLNGVTDE